MLTDSEAAVIVRSITVFIQLDYLWTTIRPSFVKVIFTISLGY